MSIASLTNKSPIETARQRLVTNLLAMKVPSALSTFPHPVDFRSLADHMREAAAIVDDYFAVIGLHIADNATTDVDMRAFEGVVTGSIEGNATHYCDCEAEALTEARDAMRRHA
jgi:hypothetical protein